MKIIITFLLYFLFQQSFALTISGKITDENNLPIPYVTVLVKGTTVGTTSNLLGLYSLNLALGKHELVFRLLGYKLKEETIDVIKDNQLLNVKLSSENYLLNEATVSANKNNIEFNTNKVLAVSELYSDICNYRYFSDLGKSNATFLNALLHYSYKSNSYSSFINGLNELFKYDEKVKFSTDKALLNENHNYSGKYQFVEHCNAGKTSSKYTLKDRRAETQIKDTILSGQYHISTKKFGDSIYFQCPGIYNEKEIGKVSIASLQAFIDAYYIPFYNEPDFNTTSSKTRILSKIGMKNERIASLIMFEKQITNFYPYKYDTLLFENRFKECLISADTSRILKDASNSDSYYNLLSYLQNVIHDNHIKIFTNMDVHYKLMGFNLPFKNLPLKLFVKDNSAFIEGVTDSTYKNLIGSKIISVNDIEIASYLKNKSNYISYTTQLSKENKLEESLYRTVLINKEYQLKLQKSDGSIETVRIKSVYQNVFQNPKQDKKWMYYINDEKTKLYVDLNNFSFSPKKVLKEIKKNKKIERVIFDVLEYPNTNALDLIAHFTTKPLLSPTFISSFTSNPFGAIVKKEVKENWTQKALQPSVNIPTVFLVRGTYSWGETFLDIIKANKIGQLIGEETGGTNGDVIYNNLELYGYKYSSIKTINNSNNLPANESTIKPDILFEKTEKNYLNYKNELIKFASTVPLNK